MNFKAYAKINLCLDVCGRRPDGYHEVRMVMQSLSLADDITITKRTDKEIRMTMEPANSKIPTDERNLMVKAAQLMQESCGISGGVDLHLVKRIPSEAGLGGGSSDAAAVIRGMNELFGPGLTPEELCALGVKIGADVPFCIMGGTMLAEGIGERLTRIKISDSFYRMHVLLAKPSMGVSTGKMYAALDGRPDLSHPDADALIKALSEGDVLKLKDCIANSFSVPVEEEIPVIGKLREDMISGGACAACMSGSGTTVFGIFEREEELLGTVERIRTGSYAGQISDVITTNFLRP